MQVFDGFEELVHHITFVDVFEQRAFLYDCMQVGICAKGQCFNMDFHRNQGEVILMERFDYYDFTPEHRNQDEPQISVCMNEKRGGKEEVCTEAVTPQSEGHAAADSAVDTHTRTHFQSQVHSDRHDGSLHFSHSPIYSKMRYMSLSFCALVTFRSFTMLG